MIELNLIFSTKFYKNCVFAEWDANQGQGPLPEAGATLEKDAAQQGKKICVYHASFIHIYCECRKMSIFLDLVLSQWWIQEILLVPIKLRRVQNRFLI